MQNKFDISSKEIKQRLEQAAQEPPHLFYPDFKVINQLVSGPPKPASVLIPFLHKGGSWHLLFTRRNANLAEHSGQVAFPGGQSDPDDTSPEQTALREAHEEIGLLPSDVNILGKLKRFLTITNYCVTPVIGIIPWPYPFNLSNEEVSRVFTIPLSWLADPANRHERLRSLPPPLDPIPVLYFDDYDGEMLWGVSAILTVALLKILKLNGSSP